MQRRVLNFLLATSMAVSVHAQQPAARPVRSAPGATTVPTNITPTPEMWFYDQELRQRYSPELAVRRKAEFETQQMMHRMAAREWFGVSLARPTANVTPFSSTYSPSWTSNTRDPNQWSASGAGAVLVPTTRPTWGVW